MMRRQVLLQASLLGCAFGQQCDEITMQAQIGIVERYCCPRDTTMASGCDLPDVCSNKCAHGFVPFFSGGCFAMATESLAPDRRAALVQFGNMCTNVRCPMAELAGRVDEVNAACSRHRRLRRRTQLSRPTLAPFADHCSNECAAVFSAFYVECEIFS